MIKKKIMDYIMSLDKLNLIMTFENNEISQEVDEIKNIPDSIFESLSQEKGIFDNNNQYAMF